MVLKKSFYPGENLSDLPQRLPTVLHLIRGYTNDGQAQLFSDIESSVLMISLGYYDNLLRFEDALRPIYMES